MIEHRQQLLTSMGIELWAPRQVAVRSIQTKSIWRDRSTDLEQEIALQTTEPSTQVAVKGELDSEKVLPTIQTKKVDIPEKQIEPKLEKQIVVSQDVVQAKSIVSEFRLHALIGAKFVLITEQQQLTSVGRVLWLNIQNALNLNSADLQWPFPLMDLQDGGAVQDYIKGFFDVVAVEKTILCLGQLPIEICYSFEQLPSLAQILEQPLGKQDLWQKVSPLIK